MKIRYIKFFYGKEATENYINYWVYDTKNIIISIESITGVGHSPYFIVLYEEKE